MSILEVVFIVLMLIWFFIGGYISYEPLRPNTIIGHLLPWFCVAILGYTIFGSK